MTNMNIVCDESLGYKDRGLARKIAVLKKDFKLIYKNDKIIKITNDDLSISINEKLRLVNNKLSIIRDVKRFSIEEDYIIIHFTRSTVAYDFLLPLCDFPFPEIVFNAFISDDNIVIHLVNNLTKMELLNHTPFFKDKYNRLYLSKIKEEFIDDYELVLESKYSKISDKAKSTIVKYHLGYNNEVPMVVLRNEKLLEELLEKFGYDNRDKEIFKDIELKERINMTNEILEDNDLIQDKKNIKKIEPNNDEVPETDRYIPWGVDLSGFNIATDIEE